MVNDSFYIALLEECRLQKNNYRTEIDYRDVANDLVLDSRLSELNYKKLVREKYLIEQRKFCLFKPPPKRHVEDKQCVRCEKILPDEFFREAFDKRINRVIRRRFCKKCESKANAIRNKRYYSTSAKWELQKERIRKWKKENKEKVKQASLEYYRRKNSLKNK